MFWKRKRGIIKIVLCLILRERIWKKNINIVNVYEESKDNKMWWLFWIWCQQALGDYQGAFSEKLQWAQFIGRNQEYWNPRFSETLPVSIYSVSLHTTCLDFPFETMVIPWWREMMHLKLPRYLSIKGKWVVSTSNWKENQEKVF